MKKRFTAMAMAMVMVATLMAGCAGTAAAPSAAPAPAAEASAPAAEAPAADKEYTKTNMVIAVHTTSTSLEYQAMEYLTQIIGERSGGAITTELYGDGVLGGEEDILEQVQTNTVQLATSGFGGTDKYIGDINCWSAPYLFTSAEQVLASHAGKLGDAVREEFNKNDMIFVGILLRGFRKLTSNKLIEKPEDLKGLKLRLPSTQAWITVWDSMGAITTPMPSSEIFQALQTGVIDAQENPISSIYAKGLWEVQKYVINTDHLADYLELVMSKNWYESLNADTQALVDECLADSIAYMDKIVAESEEGMIEDMKAKGMEFIDVDKAAFAEAAQPGLEKLRSTWQDWVYDEAMSYIQ